jgi:hypothetical protein
VKLSESKLRKIIRKSILESVSEFSPEEQDLLDREVAQLQSSQRILAKYPKATDEKEFLMNVENILGWLASEQYTPEDFRGWVGKRWPNYTVPMYQYLLDTVFNV